MSESIEIDSNTTAQEIPQDIPQSTTNAGEISPEISEDHSIGSTMNDDDDASAASQAQENSRLIRDSVNYLFNSSWYLYSTLRDKTYGTSELAKYGFDQLETMAKKSQPLAEKLLNASQPVVDNLDQNLGKVVETLHDMKKKAQETKESAQSHMHLIASPSAALSNISSGISSNFPQTIGLPAAWYTTVNEVLAPHVDISQSLTLFSTIASNAYVQLHENASRVASSASNLSSAVQLPQNVRVEYQDFLDAVRSRLGTVWSSSFAHATSAAYSHLQAKVTDIYNVTPTSVLDVKALAATVETRLKEYEASIAHTISESFRTRFTSPAIALYNAALDSYLSLYRTVSNLAASRAAQSQSQTSGIEIVEITEDEAGAEPMTGDGETQSQSQSRSSLPSINLSTIRPSLNEFLDNMKAKLGDSYAQLEGPLKTFHSKISSLGNAEIERVSTLASSFRIDQAGKLCLHDVYFSSKNVFQSLASYMNNKYADILATTTSTFDYLIPAEASVMSDDVEATATATATADATPAHIEEEENPSNRPANQPSSASSSASTSTASSAQAPRSLSEVSAHISRRLQNKLAKRLAPIKSFRDLPSRGVSKVRDLAGEGLVTRAEAALAEVDVLARRLATRARAQQDEHFERFDSSVQQAKAALGELRRYLQDSIANTRAAQTVTSTAMSYKPSLEDLKERVERATAASKDLLSASAHYAIRREFQSVPTDALDFIAQGIPTIINVERAQRQNQNNDQQQQAEQTELDQAQNESVQGLVSDVENTAVAAGVVRVHGLIEALKDVLFWSPIATPTAAAAPVAQTSQVVASPASASATNATQVPSHPTQHVASPAGSSAVTDSANNENIEATTAVAIVESEIQSALERESDSSSEDESGNRQ